MRGTGDRRRRAHEAALIEFWTFGCGNCQRTLPFLRQMRERYQNGFTVIGVHTPEFEYERSVSNVQRAVREAGIEYPVGLDNDYAAWKAYGSRYWPSLYLVDRGGQVRYTQIGEGHYQRTEASVRALLAEADRPRVDDGPDQLAEAQA